jgi:hypothetical protein
MKNIFIALLCIVSANNVQSQTIRRTINEKRIGSITSDYYMEITGTDTSYNLYCSFQNRKYTAITDIGSVYVFDMDESKSGVRKIIKDLEKCLPYLEQGDVSVTIGNFQVHDFSSQLFVQDGRKYTTITKSQVKKWITWLRIVVLEEVEQEN